MRAEASDRGEHETRRGAHRQRPERAGLSIDHAFLQRGDAVDERVREGQPHVSRPVGGIEANPVVGLFG